MLLLPLPPETLIACHLDAKDLPAVAEARALALEHAGRVEAAPILPKLAKTFYESPYTDPRRWAQDLCELQEIFYEAKNRTEWPDAVLLARLRRLYDGPCGGDMQAVANWEDWDDAR